MKVCQIFGYGPDKLGGIENYIFKMQELCTSQDIDIIFVFTREPIQQFKDIFNKLNGKYVLLPAKKRVIDIVFMKNLHKFLKQYNPDVVHSHFDSANLNVAIIANLLGVKKIYWHQRNLFGSKLFKIRNLIYRTVSKKVTKIIAVSNGVKFDLISRGIEERVVWKLYNGIDIEKMKGENLSTLTNELGISDKKIILTVAQARPEKDLITLLRSIPLIKNNELFVFIVIGGGPLVDELKKEAVKLQLTNIVFVDKRNDIKNLMTEGEFLILPSKKEGLPNVILEAMLNKLPVIASNAGGIPEIVANGQTGLIFEIGNYRELAEQMKRLIDDPKLSKDISTRAYEEVIKKFDLNKTVKITLDEYLC